MCVGVGKELGVLPTSLFPSNLVYRKESLQRPGVPRPSKHLSIPMGVAILRAEGINPPQMASTSINGAVVQA